MHADNTKRDNELTPFCCYAKDLVAPFWAQHLEGQIVYHVASSLYSSDHMFATIAV